MRHLSSLAGLICLLWVLMPVRAAETDNQDGEAALLAQLSQWQHLSATFEQQDSSQTGEIQKGRVWISRPDRFRIEMDAPLSQTIVSDGKTLWTWDRDLEQVIINHLTSSVSDVPVLLFAGEPDVVAGRFDVERFPDSMTGENQTWFRLRPLEDNAVVRGMTLLFDDQGPIGIGITTTMDQETYVELRDVTFDEQEASLFEFEVPEFADVIDDRT